MVSLAIAISDQKTSDLKYVKSVESVEPDLAISSVE
jgi:hypothetical protein